MKTIMKEQLYTKYAALVTDIKKLEAEAKEAKQEILADLTANGLDKYQTPEGTYSVIPTKTWVYSEKVDMLKAMMEAQKEEEVEKGIALVEETPTLRFQLKK